MSKKELFSAIARLDADKISRIDFRLNGVDVASMFGYYRIDKDDLEIWRPEKGGKDMCLHYQNFTVRFDEFWEE